MAADCPFCAPGREPIAQNVTAVAVEDAFPVAEGHALVIPRKHVASVFDLPEEQQADLWRLVAEVRGRLAERLGPDGFTIGVNDGEAAGQTVAHAHVHLIPRRHGDTPDPRGGLRLLFPDRARYWDD